VNYDTAILTAPQGEPIHLDHAKLHCGITDTDRDALFPAWIANARERIESSTNRQILHARHALTMPCFPADSCRVAKEWRYLGIVLPHAPVVRVVSISYLDTDGASQTLDAATYVVNTTKVPATIVPKYGYTWPTTYDAPEAVTVTYDVGYASPFTADATADTITVAGPVTWTVGAAVRFQNSGGALPGGILAGRDYYVRSAPGAGAYTLSATSGGALLDLTDAGSGLNLIGEVPASMLAWMLLQIEQLAQIRGATEVVERGQATAMPFVDSLLERFRVYLP
jgi:uncharacterized phiE125 gp8 family phage protein